MLNQRLNDLKKTLQNELKMGNRNADTVNKDIISSNGDASLDNSTNDKKIENNWPMNKHFIDRSIKQQTNAVVMDDINFKYLKFIILKFFTSREV